MGSTGSTFRANQLPLASSSTRQETLRASASNPTTIYTVTVTEVLQALLNSQCKLIGFRNKLGVVLLRTVPPTCPLIESLTGLYLMSWPRTELGISNTLCLSPHRSSDHKRSCLGYGIIFLIVRSKLLDRNLCWDLSFIRSQVRTSFLSVSQRRRRSVIRF